MKKLIPAMAILGGIVAFVAYKSKKDEKAIIDLDEGLLSDPGLSSDETYEEAPISNPASCCLDETKNIIHDFAEDSKKVANEIKDKSEAVIKDTKKKIKKSTKTITTSFPNIKKSQMDKLVQKVKDSIKEMKAAGDDLSNERPIEHHLTFKDSALADKFMDFLSKEGFTISKGDDEFEWRVLHVAPLKEDDLLQKVLYIADKAIAHKGVYHGWHAKVMF